MQRVCYQNLSSTILSASVSTRAPSLWKMFKIARVTRGDINVYEFVDHEDESIIGKLHVYEEVVNAVDKNDDVYRVEKVLKRKKVKVKNVVLVKWLGYDSKHSSWIPESSIQNIADHIQHTINKTQQQLDTAQRSQSFRRKISVDYRS